LANCKRFPLKELQLSAASIWPLHHLLPPWIRSIQIQKNQSAAPTTPNQAPARLSKRKRLLYKGLRNQELAQKLQIQEAPNSRTQRHRRSVRRRSDGEEERSPDYLIPRTRRRLPHPNAAGKPTPHTGIGTKGEEADEPKAAVFNAAGGHATQEDSAHQQPKDRRKQNVPPWIEPRHLHPQTNEGSDTHSTSNPSYLALTT